MVYGIRGVCGGVFIYIWGFVCWGRVVYVRGRYLVCGVFMCVSLGRGWGVEGVIKIDFVFECMFCFSLE